MSDKSFGDYTNRNIVKNPLLATAVTGLSIEDLTHNAVLLPVVPNQGLISSQDTTQSQPAILADVNRNPTHFQSGDADSNPIVSQIPREPKEIEPHTVATKAKADDFDVSEYFARLQGTRYVSAPHNCPLNENRTGLQAEENLEEINLNDNQNAVEVQQSLTADIAQNFSQLPQVLPQVASAVFNSFSSMLSLKSREHTPEKVAQTYGLQENYQQNLSEQSATVPVAFDAGTNAPPPKEPPKFTNTGNTFRMTTRKKVYAPIPGLSTGEAAVSSFQMPPCHNRDRLPSEMHSFFDPTASQQNLNQTATQSIPDANRPVSVDNAQDIALKFSDDSGNTGNLPANIDAFAIQNNTTPVAFKESISQVPVDVIHKDVKMFQPAELKQPLINQVPPSASSTFQAPINAEVEQTTAVPTTNIQSNQQPPASIIPPPPMFSSLPPRSNVQSSSSIHRSIIPPSVARRISSNQPALKTSTVLTPCDANIFVPTLTENTIDNINTGTQDSIIIPQYTQTIRPEFPPVQNTDQSKETAPALNAIPNFTTENIPTIHDFQPASTAPTFFSPQHFDSNLESKPLPIITNVSASVSTGQHSQELQSDIPKPVPEPPKVISGPQYFRMSKKRPQYYSGPIEGIGSISNSIKPIIPSVEPSNQAYQGSFFVPDQAADPSSNTSNNDQIINQSTNIFDINRPTNMEANVAQSTYPTIDVNSSQVANQNVYQQPQYIDVNPPQAANQNVYQYDTAFDFTRPTVDNYDFPKEESKSFGLIGSLKSKLSAIDINKIQNSVTTFFDPTYNNTKVDNNQQEFKNTTGYNEYPQTSGSHGFEIFVPNVQNIPQDIVPQQTSSQYPIGFSLDGLSQTHTHADHHNYYQYQPQYSDSAQTGEYKFQPTYAVNERMTTDNSVNITNTPVENLYQSTGQTSGIKNRNDTSSQASSFTSITQDFIKSSESISSFNANVFKSTVPLDSLASSMSDTSVYFQSHKVKSDSIPMKMVTMNEDTSQIYNPIVATSAIETTHTSQNIQGIPTDITSNTHVLFSSSIFGSNSETSQHFIPKIPEAVHTPHYVPQTQDLNPQAIEMKISSSQYQPQTHIIQSSQNITLKDAFTDDRIEHSKTQIDTTNLENNKNIFAQESVNQTDNVVSNISPEIFNPIPHTDKEINNIFGTIPHNVEDTSFFDMNSLTMKPQVIEKESPVASTASLFTSNPLTKDQEHFTHLMHDISKININATDNNIPQYTFMKNTESINTDVEEVLSKIDNVKLENDSETITDFNICETCREVNKPDERETEDLTTQLIENITAPIQLLNPVVVPLSEDRASIEDRTEFDTMQCEEISHITEETIEAIQVRAANDSFDSKTNDKFEIDGYNFSVEEILKNYDWCPDNSEQIRNPLLESNFNLESNVNTIGFIDNDNSLFPNISIPTNASDEIKAEYGIVNDDNVAPVILSRQMSIPTAPPAEDLDDTKSDSGIIDVQLIEQDAKQDFPLFEEYVIEPSETDDDKIEYKERGRSSEDPIQDIDSFTNRVEKFKQSEESVDIDNTALTNTVENILPDNINQHRQPVRLYECFPSLTSPTTIASYFDTGNYAAEAHYRNSLLSSSPIGTPHQNVQFNSLLSPDNIPCCVTENTIVDADNISISTLVQEILAPIITNDDEIESNIPTFETESLTPQLLTNIHNPTITENIVNRPEDVFNNTLSIDGQKDQAIDSQKEEHIASIQPINIFGNPPTHIIDNAALPDPMNFFSSVPSNTPSQIPKSESDASFNRLASYFASPAKAIDNSKSFFELSKGQDHYKLNTLSTQTSKDIGPSICKTNPHNLDRRKNDDANSESGHPKSFFELSQSQDHYIDNNNVAVGVDRQQYLERLQLMKDLTSYENFTPSNESIVRTANYFDIYYDNFNTPVMTDSDRPQTEYKSDEQNLVEIGTDDVETHTFGEIEDKIVDNPTILQTIVNNCKYCRNSLGAKTVFNVQNVTLGVNGLDSDYRSKMKKTMDKETKAGEPPKDEQREVTVERVSRPLVPSIESSDSEFEDGLRPNDDNRSTAEYSPVKHHWFYRFDCEGKSIWRGFSLADSQALEEAYISPDLNEDTLVATDGGRYDVNIIGRLRFAVYWTDKPTNVRRCSWFYKGTTDARYVPYTEAVAEKLEAEYRYGVHTGEWHRRLALPNNEAVVMHGPAVMVHFLQTSTTDTWGTSTFFGKRVYRNPPKIRVTRDQTEKVDHLLLLVHGAGEWRHQRQKIQSTMRPRVVRRGCEETEIEDTQPSNIDHLLLLCHGVGSACDMRFRSVEEVVDDFRTTSCQLLQSHYRSAYDNGDIGRIEVLPISWHSTLHSGESGVDKRLAQITLDSIPKLRNFTNDTVLDVLFYTSPVFCQTIVDTVCKELNRVYSLFRSRNPAFAGGVSLGGHSLGSVILYDLLCHQTPPASAEGAADKKYVAGPAGTGQPLVQYPRLDFAPDALYALGSPIAIFECIRGVETLGEQFSLPTCTSFFNIFHPYDPIAYRMEPLISAELKNVPPYLIPHHKGRKRMHLELKDTMARVGADIKQRLIESLKSTWSSVWRAQPPSTEHLEKVVEEEIEKERLADDHLIEENNASVPPPHLLGALNAGRRVDYVLQEAPFEMINEYLFAMTSHLCYWESEDTMLLMLREMYAALGVEPDCTVPQQTMTVQRARASASGEDVGMKPEIPEMATTSRNGL